MRDHSLPPTAMPAPLWCQTLLHSSGTHRVALAGGASTRQGAALRALGRRVGRLVIAAALLAVPAAAHAQAYADTTLFAVDNSTTLYTVNRLTGASTAVGTLLFTTSALARDPVTGRLYYTATNAATPNGRVAYWDPATGTNTLLNASGLNDAGVNDNVVRLTFSSAGVLYGIGATPATLYTINTSTGAYTSLGLVKVGSTAGADLGGSGDIAFDFDGTLYAGALDATNQTTLYRISLVPSGGAFVATATGVIVNTQQASLAFVADGRLYSAGANRAIYAVSKSGGASTTIVAPNAGPIAYYDFATLPRFADLSVSGSTAGLPRGGNATFNISVSNAGPQFANGPITVVDTLAAGLTYSGVSGGGWTCTAVGQIVTCAMPGPLAVGATSSFVLTTAVAAGAVGTTLNSTLHVTGSTIDQAQANNRTVVTGTTVVNVDFAVTKTHAGSFTAGQNGTYTISVRNTGTVVTVGTVTTTDTLPVGMTWVSGTGPGWTCSRSGVGVDIVTCTNATAIAAGATTTITLTVAVARAAAPSRTNTVYVSGGGALSSRSASDPTTVNYYAVTLPDLAAVSQLPSNATTYTATFTVTNTGTLNDSYVLTAAKAPGVSIAITSVRGTAGTSGGTVAVAAGASLSIPVVYTVVPSAAAGAVDTLKLVATSVGNAQIAATGAIVVNVVKAGLTIAKTLYRADRTTVIAPGSQVAIGETVNFLVTVRATGAVPSTAVRVSDPLPLGVTYLSVSPDAAGWTIAQAAGTVTADLAGTLAAGTSRFFWISVRVQ